MFYHYRQNNTGGSFTGPAISVIIEADCASEADDIAEAEAGLYFDGVDAGIDCSCCGDRWYRAYGKGDDTPSDYGGPVEDSDAPSDNWLHDSVRKVRIYRKTVCGAG